MQKKKYVGSKLSRDIFASAFAHVPAASSSGREILISVSVYSFLKDVGWSKKNLARKVSRSSTPSQSCMEKILAESAARKFVLLKNDLESKRVKLYLACDKENKKGISHFVNNLAYWCEKEKCVKKVLLDVDASAGTSKACAEAVDHSLKKVDLPEERKILSGQNTDAGGGGTGKSFRIELTKVQ